MKNPLNNTSSDLNSSEHIQSLETEIHSLKIEKQTLEAENQNLKQQYNKLIEQFRLAQKARFASSSEKAKYILSDENQLRLFDEAETLDALTPSEETDESEETNTVEVKPYTRKAKRTKEELAKSLPVYEVTIKISEDESTCGICQSDLTPIGRELVRREISTIPAKAFITETYRVNYSCEPCHKETDEANIIKPSVPEPVIKRGIASPSSVAHIMYQKYVNAQPLYRQEKDWANFGVDISRATLANWIIYTSNKWLLPLCLLMQTMLLKQPIISADETVTQVLKEPGKTPQSQSRMWVYTAGRGSPIRLVLFEYKPDRGGIHPESFLNRDTPFYLQTDGYAGYSGVKNATLCGCWSHMRRKFEEAMPKGAKPDNPARQGLEFCQKLFILERSFEGLESEERLTQRLEKSKPILEAFFAWVENSKPLAGCKFATAITYAKNQQAPLSAFLLDGNIELSNNRAENAIRPFVVGRKNWLFSDTVAGAMASAVVYSVIETANLNKLNPFEYLMYLFTELPSVLVKNPDADLSNYLPWAAGINDRYKALKRKHELISANLLPPRE